MLLVFNAAYLPVIGYYLILALKLTTSAKLATGWHISSTTLAFSSAVNPILTLVRSHDLNFMKTHRNRVGVMQWPLEKVVSKSDTVNESEHKR